MPAKKTTRPSATTDLWSKWFNALIQVVGLAMFVYQGVFQKTDRPWLLVMCGALMIGGFGVRMFVRGASGVLAAAAEQIEEEPDE